MWFDKLLLSGEDWANSQSFRFDSDQSQPSSVFAKVIVQLPSVCEGGELVVQDENSVMVHDFGQASGMSAYAVHYAVFYTHMTADLKAVTKGQQKQICGARPSTWAPDDSERNWVDGAVQGVDKLRIDLLQAANETLPAMDQYVFLLARCSHTSSYEKHGRKRKRHGPSMYQLDRWFTMQGHPLASRSPRAPFDIGGMAAGVLNQDRTPLKQLWTGQRVITCSPLSGNSYDVDVWYPRFLVVAVPRTQYVPFVARYFDEWSAYAVKADARNDPVWFFEMLQHAAIFPAPHTLSHTLLQRALQFQLVNVVIALLRTFFNVHCGQYLLSELVAAPRSFIVRDTALAALGQLEHLGFRFRICTKTASGGATMGLDAETLAALVQMAPTTLLAVADEDSAREASISASNIIWLLHILIKRNAVDSAHQVVQSAAFRDLQSHRVEEDQWAEHVLGAGLAAMPSLDSRELGELNLQEQPSRLARVVMNTHSDKWLQILVDKALSVPPRLQDYGRILLDAAKDQVAPMSSKARIVAPLARAAYDKYMKLAALPRASLAIPDATFAPVGVADTAASMAMQAFLRSDAQETTIQACSATSPMHAHLCSQSRTLATI
ncbi:hypothetical protein GGF32_007090 [Allomyces javanicus]|nr:hypothetical protein GGF32_007090 [Allomyces javanicus]